MENVLREKVCNGGLIYHVFLGLFSAHGLIKTLLLSYAKRNQLSVRNLISICIRSFIIETIIPIQIVSNVETSDPSKFFGWNYAHSIITTKGKKYMGENELVLRIYMESQTLFESPMANEINQKYKHDDLGHRKTSDISKSITSAEWSVVS